MNPTHAELSYRRASVQEASPAGLMVILYDILAGDLRQAIVAMRSGKIEERGARLKHGLVVLELLEGWLDPEKGGAAARSLSQFYTYLRSQMLAAQFQGEERTLEELIVLILDVREAWRQTDSGTAQTKTPNLAPQPSPPAARTTTVGTGGGTGWSA